MAVLNNFCFKNLKFVFLKQKSFKKAKTQKYFFYFNLTQNLPLVPWKIKFLLNNEVWAQCFSFFLILVKSIRMAPYMFFVHLFKFCLYLFKYFDRESELSASRIWIVILMDILYLVGYQLELQIL